MKMTYRLPFEKHYFSFVNEPQISWSPKAHESLVKKHTQGSILNILIW